MIDFEALFRSYVSLDHQPNHKGWYPVVCQVCNDHGRKGKRAAFNFDNGLGYHCYNCGHIASFNDKSTTLSDNVITVLERYNIPKSEWEPIYIDLLAKQPSNKKTTSSNNERSIEPVKLDLPTHFKPLLEYPEDYMWRVIAEDHLVDVRSINPTDYPFYLSEHPDWIGRLIIPIYNRKNDLIYYQGRSLIDHKRKYLSPSEDKSRILYGFNQIYNHSISPLFVVEGFFDAFVIDGCATLGNKLTEEQIQHLTRSTRKKVIIPDRLGDGHIMANQAIKLGWCISTPNIGECKDISAAVRKYGRMYVNKSIIDNITEGLAAEINVKMFCK